MKLGILLAGRVNETLVDRVGEVDTMFEALYRSVDPTIELQTWAVLDNRFPATPRDADAWLVTGSKFGVYDELPWIDPLKGFLRDARAARVPMIGICFGHQLMAEAFGGRAEKFRNGWGVGIHRYKRQENVSWMDGAIPLFDMHAMHQDQVTALPDDATVLASSSFCNYAMLSYGDPESPDAISIQPHPEFSNDYASGLLDLRGGTSIPEDTTAAARASLGAPTHGADFAAWSIAYLTSALARRAAA